MHVGVCLRKEGLLSLSLASTVGIKGAPPSQCKVFPGLLGHLAVSGSLPPVVRYIGLHFQNAVGLADCLFGDSGRNSFPLGQIDKDAKGFLPSSQLCGTTV